MTVTRVFLGSNMAGASSEMLHATTVAIAGRAVMLSGASGAGKSDLALRLIDRGATLVSDDYTIARRTPQGNLIASVPDNIAGKMEVRGIGILPFDYVNDVPVALLVELSDMVERMPADGMKRVIAGVAVPVIRLAAPESSAPIKVELALSAIGMDKTGK